MFDDEPGTNKNLYGKKPKEPRSYGAATIGLTLSSINSFVLRSALLEQTTRVAYTM